MDIIHDLPKLASDAFKQAAKQVLSIDDATLLGSSSTIAGKIILLGANNFGPPFVSMVIESFIKTDADEVKKISLKLTKLIRLPMLTGIDQFQTAIKITPTNESERLFQQDRLKDALKNFDNASQLCEEQERLNIELLRCITLFKLDGGLQEAKQRVEFLYELCAKKLQQLEEERGKVVKRFIKENDLINDMDTGKPQGGRGLLGSSSAIDPLKKANLEYSVKVLSKKKESLDDEINSLYDTCSLVGIARET